MGYVINYGEIKTNKAIIGEAKEIIESTLGEEDVCDVGESTIYIEEYYDKNFEQTIAKVIEKITPLGYVLNGDVEYMGDWEGRIVIKNNSVGELSRELAAVVDAGDEELIAELESRGYTVNKGMNLTDLFGRFLGVQEGYRELYHIYEDLKEAGATDEELEYFGYENFLEEIKED